METIGLFDGRAALLRPIAPGDAEALVRFHEHLSRDTIHLRFFNLHLRLTPAEVERFTCVDGTDRVALVVEAGGEVLAVGRYDRLDEPSTAEVAFVVADAYQGHGLGSLLLTRLAERARAVGITTFCAQTLVGNQLMLGVFRDSGFPMRTHLGPDAIEVVLDLAAPPAGTEA